MLIEIAQMVSNQPESCHHVVMRNVIEMRSTTQVRRHKISENMDQRLVKFATKFRKLGSQKSTVQYRYHHGTGIMKFGTLSGTVVPSVPRVTILTYANCQPGKLTFNVDNY
jgi:hypothetical protein